MAEQAKKLKGICFFYFNLYPDLGQDVASTMQMIKEMVKPLTEKLTEDGRYVCVLVPTTKEATRVDKVDYDSPFPRYMPRGVDVQKVGLVPPKKKKSVFQQDEATMKGVIMLYLNFWPDLKIEPKEILDLVRALNQEAFSAISQDGQYQVMVVPTTKEASRVEKIDLEDPFPRLVPKQSEKRRKTKINVIPPKAVLNDMLNKDDDDIEEDPDEVDDEELEQEGKE